MTGSPWEKRANQLIQHIALRLGLDPEKDERQMISAVQQYEHYYAAFPDDPIDNTANRVSAREATIVEAIIMLHRGTYDVEGLRDLRDAGGVDVSRAIVEEQPFKQVQQTYEKANRKGGETQ